MIKKKFDIDHAPRGLTSPEEMAGLTRHQEGSWSPDEHQTSTFQEPLRNSPSNISSPLKKWRGNIFKGNKML
jgi:hypothetical protein